VDVPAEELKPLRRLVENVSIAAGLPVTPELRVVQDAAPNAYAAGLRPERSYVGVTTGLLATMPQRELEAVLAHEIAHIRNRDTYLMTIATVFAGVIALIADIGFRAIAYGGRSRKGGVLVLVAAIVGFVLAPYAALLLRMSLSRRREFLADAGAAEILNDPEAMALALRRLALDPTTVRYADASTAHLWVESPTDRVDSERRGVLALTSWFNTHPSVDSRIEALEEAGGFRLPERLETDPPFGAVHGLV
jgi:heat shock protein HtpX